MVKYRGLKGANHEAVSSNGYVHRFTDREAADLFDKRARYHLGISGDEFINRWERGHYEKASDRPEVMSVAMLLPLVKE